jgi:hypothetical protein
LKSVLGFFVRRSLRRSAKRKSAAVAAAHAVAAAGDIFPSLFALTS